MKRSSPRYLDGAGAIIGVVAGAAGCVVLAGRKFVKCEFFLTQLMSNALELVQ